MTKRANLTTFLLLTLFSTPAAATGANPEPPRRDDLAGRYRQTASTGSLRAVLGQLGERAFPSSAPAVPIPATNMAAALRGLADAVRDADRVVRDAVPAERRAEVLRALVRTYAGSVRRDRPRPIPWVERAARAVDLPAMITAARRIGASIDAVLAAPRPRALRGAAPTCDVVDQAPLVCVSSTGAQTYTEDRHWLTVDLGGDDVYRNHVGVGACIGDLDDQEPDPCVGVGLDLGGDDRYEPPGLFHACEAGGRGPDDGICAQGAGLLGIGMLVDAEGSDSYDVLGRPKGTTGCLDTNFSICGVIDSQGSGRFGVGVLADLAGHDTYTTRFPHAPADAPKDQNVGVITQGTALFGAALLWDGDGNDTYLVEGPATGYPSGLSVWGWSSYSAQGVGVAGEAVLLDESGSDRFTVRTRPGPGAENRKTTSPWGEGGSSGLSFDNGGQGIGVSGAAMNTVGALITGEGDTVYELDFGGRFQAWVHGQGDALGGLLDDQGGNDRYRMASTVEATIDERCECTEEALLEMRFMHERVIQGQGSTYGRLVDRSGDDTYEIVARGALVGRMRSLNEGVPANITVHGGQSLVGGQGVALGQLLDASGDDRYLIDARTTTSGEAIAQEADRLVTTNGGSSVVSGQGATGWLVDRGGEDAYDIEVEERATASPERPGGVDEGAITVDGQGLAGDAGGITDVDAGELDRFSIDSPLLFEMCSGTYGASPGWAGGVRRNVGSTTGPEQCSTNRARSTVTSALDPGAATTLQFLSSDAITGSDPAALRVRLALRDATGAPVAGARVRLVPQSHFGEPYYQIGPFHRWTNLWDGSRELVTGSDGIAEGVVMAPACARGSDCAAPRRLTALYFGEAGRYQPSRAVRA